tara:strand:- start:1403 stop:1999 length:597 start_codon:yes stop_codon:yes gene_type:complete
VITFIDLNNQPPYLEFKKRYSEALSAKQENIEAINIASYSKKDNEVNSRFVNLKIIQNDEFIFFTNYESPKSQEFLQHKQISASIYWSSIDFQIRIKANIKKTSKKYNQIYFENRHNDKNALAISSSQSKKIDSYGEILSQYEEILANSDLKKCPSYWGGFSFKPYYFEFWKGHQSRINKREVYELSSNKWNFYLLQP